MSHVLQHLVMPNLAFGAPEEMYARLHNDKVHALMSEGRMLFEAGGRASFDTFFNSVTVGVWKTHTAVQDLQLHLRGSGRFIVRLGLHRIGHAHRWLAERVVTLTLEQDIVLPIESWSNLESGMLYFALEALESGSITEGHFATLSTPQQEVKLGIVITHFNRKQWVLPAIARIRNELLKDPLYKDRIELVVVDNSQNITTEEAEGVTLIPNKNLGGSGGFTRGLLYLKDQKNFTHCLFMDDDASCEIESIRRALHLMAHFVDDERTIAGSLLRELEPHRLFEKGARFDGLCIPLKSGMDVRAVNDLLWSEHSDMHPTYGGWWFFGFPLKAVKQYPFPFFVRGDDIRFGMDNKLRISTINGVACWGEDFSLKSGPLPLYLDVRNHSVALLTALNASRLRFFGVAAQFVFSQLFSYNYASARACVIALEDVMKGPSFFEDNMDAKKIREKIGGLMPAEKMLPMNRADVDLIYGVPFESKWRKIIRGLTLNGFLVPSLFIQKNTVFQHKNFRASFREVFLKEKIYYEHEPSGVAYIAAHSKKDFFVIVFDFGLICWKYFWKYQCLRDAYNKAWSRITTEEFWRNVYAKK